jgi:hypothetical protein
MTQALAEQIDNHWRAPACRLIACALADCQ